MTLTTLLWLFLSGLFWDDTRLDQSFPLPALRRCAATANLDGPSHCLFTAPGYLLEDLERLLILHADLGDAPVPSQTVQFRGHDLRAMRDSARHGAAFFEARISNTEEKRLEANRLAGEYRRLSSLYDRLIFGLEPDFGVAAQRRWLREAKEIVGEQDWYAGRLPQPPTIPR